MLALKVDDREIQMPLFLNHQSARHWFKQNFGSRFVMVDSVVEDGIKFYIYHLIHDKMVYLQSMNAIREGSPFIHHDFENSYEVVEISEYGYVYFKKKGK